MTLVRLSLLPFVLTSAVSAQGQISGLNDDRAQPGTLPVEEIRAMLAAPGAHEPFVPEAPLGIRTDLATLIPADNPLTPAKVELGRQLYFDKRLSKRRHGLVRHLPRPRQAAGRTTRRSRPASLGQHGRAQRADRHQPRARAHVQFWDGRAATLEEQAARPDRQPDRDGLQPSKRPPQRLN